MNILLWIGIGLTIVGFIIIATAAIKWSRATGNPKISGSALYEHRLIYKKTKLLGYSVILAGMVLLFFTLSAG